MASTTETVVTALLSSGLGGAIGAWSAHRVMREQQREARRQKQEDARHESAVRLIGAFQEVLLQSFDEAGSRLGTPPALEAIGALKRELAQSTPALADLGIEERLGEAVELVQVRDELASEEGLDDPEALKVLMRFHADRRRYVTWVIASLQDVASGDKLPPGGPGPAPVRDVHAAPWEEPKPRSALSPSQMTRRKFSDFTAR
jgi:hypothetical protein